MADRKRPGFASGTRSGIAGVGLIVVLWASPVVVLAATTFGAEAEQKESITGSTSTVVTVGTRQPEERQPVQVVLDEGAATQLRSALSGTVTSITATPRQAIASGAELFAVDGHPMFAMSGGVPLHRDLKEGDTGTDVRALQAFLADRGALGRDAIDGRFGPRVRAAVLQFQREASYDTDGVFRRSYVLFVPPGFGAISSLEIGLGDELSGDRVIVTGSAPIVSVRFIRSGTEDEPAVPPGAPVTLQAGETALELPSLRPAVESWASLRDFLLAGVARGHLQSSAGAGDTPARTTYSGAHLAYSAAEARGTVPSNAVLLTAAGVRCVFESGLETGWQERGSKVHRLTSVTADATEIGVTLIDDALRARVVARDAGSLPEGVRERCTP